MSEPTRSLRYKRVLLKLSGEALMGDGKYGIHPPTLTRIAGEMKEVVQAGRGAGRRDWRRQHLPRRGRAPPRAWTARAPTTWACSPPASTPWRMQDALEKQGVHTRVLSRHQDGADRRALHPPARRAPPGEGPRRHLRRRHRQPVLHHRHRRRLRAMEINAEVILKATKVDGIYNADPKKDPDGAALPHAHLHGRAQAEPERDGLHGHLAVHGQQAAHRRVRPDGAGNIGRAVLGNGDIGTVVGAAETVWA